MSIAFGTSGWRARIADQFTFDNVRRVSRAIADHVKAHGAARRGIVVGYDTRFLSEHFAKAAAETVAGAGVRAFLADRDTPTPVVAHEIRRRKAAGGINITASHNPPEYNGLKFSAETGGPALVAQTADIERRVARAASGPVPASLPWDTAVRRGVGSASDPRAAYLTTLRRLVDLRAIRKAKLSVVCDPLFGTARGYTDAILEEAGCRVASRNDHRDVLFGGAPPEPTPERLRQLAADVRARRAHIGLSNDGDADRFGYVEPDGTVLSPNQILVVLLDHLVRTRRWRGCVVRTVATTHLLDRMAAKHGLELRETPVGFKYIGAVMEREDVLLGGEESGGLSVYRHVPEKDGILACLLLAEARAVAGRQLSDRYRSIEKEYGAFRSGRLDLHLTTEAMARFRKKLPALRVSALAGRTVEKEDRQDGVKWNLSGGAWVLLRLSGTEPLVRVYGEAGSAGALGSILAAGRTLVGV